PRRAPAAAVSSGEVVVRSTPIGEPAERLAQRADDIAGDERLFAHALGGDVPGEAVQVDTSRRRLRRVDPAREQRPEDAGQYIPRSAARHAGVAGRIDQDATIRGGDERTRALE